jgi:hypothetical protein
MEMFVVLNPVANVVFKNLSTRHFIKFKKEVIMPWWFWFFLGLLMVYQGWRIIRSGK